MLRRSTGGDGLFTAMRYPILILCAAACAAAADPLSVPHDDNPDPNRSQIRQMQHETRPPVPESEGGDEAVSMSEDDLVAQPDLLQNALNTAVARQQVENIRFLLPLYRRLDEKRRDAVLEAYAESFLLREDGQYARAEEKLRAILAQNPGYAPVRLQLALTLSQSGQTREAAAEVAKVKAVPDLPPDTAAYLDSFSAYLKRERAWQFDANAYYIAERNVGRAPKEREYGPWRFPEARAAHGLGYEASAGKTVPLKKHWAARVQASVYGKFYWDAHDYDDLNARIEAGPVYRSGSGETSLMPFAEKRWYGTQAYSHTAGGVLRHSHNLSAKTMLFTSWQTGYKQHGERDHLDGASHGGALSLVYQSSPQQYFVFGAGAGRENARDPSEAYRHGSLRAGWTRRWSGGEGLATSLNGSVRRSLYRAEDFFNIRRRDTEYSVRVSAGHKKLSWKGFTPRLNWTWSYLASNHFYYRRHESRVFLDVSKQF